MAMKLQHDKEKFTKQLVTWYDEHKRSLPWREEPLPYHIWVSEIMLQQTRVEAVKPFYDRFMKALPTLSALANAEDDRLAKLWEGLGYYNRVRNMKKCAIQCMQEHHGRLPSSYEELLNLPGIGAYTAGAIASIAFQLQVPAVDGNVLRVFSRVLISYDDILKEATKKKFQAIIQTYIPQRSDAFNQALMELGALVCVPNAAPRCNICPVASECMGYQSGEANQLPIKQAKKARRIEKKTVFLFMKHNHVYIQQRKDAGLLAGLYEFYQVDESINKTKAIEIAKSFGTLINIKKLPNAKHIFSHIEWHMQGYVCILEDTSVEGLWVDEKEIKEVYSIPTAYKVYKDALLAIWEE